MKRWERTEMSDVVRSGRDRSLFDLCGLSRLNVTDKSNIQPMKASWVSLVDNNFPSSNIWQRLLMDIMEGHVGRVA
jgi:hypothetical protein